MARPSEKRRENLRQRDCASVYILNNLVPLERYFAIADTLLSKFQEASDDNDLDNAYVMGKRLYKFCAQVLPSHDYYDSPKLLELRVRNLANLSDVADKLEIIVELMDLEEVEREEKETRLKLEKLEGEKRRKLAQVQRERESVLERHKSFLNKKGSSSSVVESSSGEDVSKSALEKLKLLALQPKGHYKPPSYSQSQSAVTASSTVTVTTTTNNNNNNYTNILPPALPPPVLLPDDDDTSSMTYSTAPTNISTDMPIVTPPPDDDDEPPPAYQQVVRNSNHAHLLSPLIQDERHHDDNDQKNHSHTTQPSSSPEDNLVPIQELTSLYKQECEALKLNKEIEVFTLATYQGRNNKPGRDSTNGCAVISPLVAITYLNSGSPGLTDAAIEAVIDDEAPPILNSVRGKLGLPQSALIIPSDVHDYLVDAKILRQSMFVGVCGGNLLNPVHVEVLLRMLRTGRDGANDNDNDNNNNKDYSHKKIAAALFFHEHVVSILKLNHTHTGEHWYDLIDSLPSNNNSRGATRTRCKNIRSLESTLRWYACHKFTDHDQKYINANVWHEELCDFDPRVFQAFVWIEQPTRNGLCA